MTSPRPISERLRVQLGPGRSRKRSRREYRPLGEDARATAREAQRRASPLRQASLKIYESPVRATGRSPLHLPTIPRHGKSSWDWHTRVVSRQDALPSLRTISNPLPSWQTLLHTLAEGIRIFLEPFAPQFAMTGAYSIPGRTENRERPFILAMQAQGVEAAATPPSKQRSPTYYPIHPYFITESLLHGIEEAAPGERITHLILEIHNNKWPALSELREAFENRPNLKEIFLRMEGERGVYLRRIDEEAISINYSTSDTDRTKSYPTSRTRTLHFTPDGGPPRIEEVDRTRDVDHSLSAMTPPEKRLPSLTPLDESRLRTILPPWHSFEAGRPLQVILTELREAHGLSRNDALVLFNAEGASIRPQALKHYEGPKHVNMPFEKLAVIASVYGVDIRDLVAASNRSNYPSVVPNAWLTEGYPLYLESTYDLQCLDNFQRNPDRSHLARLIFTARKNPDAYQSVPMLTQDSSLDRGVINRIETSNLNPEPQYLDALAKRLPGVEVDDIVMAINHDHHPDLPLEDLFPDQIIYIDPRSRTERDNVKYYQNNPEDSILAKELFAHRKSRYGYVTSAQLSKALGKHRLYWYNREVGQYPPDKNNWPEWLWLYKKMGINPENLIAYLIQHDIIQNAESPAFLLAEGLDGESLESLEQRTRIPSKTIGLILQLGSSSPSTTVTRRIILELQRALPKFAGDRFYRMIYPDVTLFFPEVALDTTVGETSGETSRPYLVLSRAQIDEAARFDLGVAILDYRITYNVDQPGFASAIGSEDPTFAHYYERLVVNIENERMLYTLAGLLGVDPRVAYVSLRPEVIQLFEVRTTDPSAEAMVTLTIRPDQYATFLSKKNKLRDPSNMRDQIRVALSSRSIRGEKAFAQYLEPPVLTHLQAQTPGETLGEETVKRRSEHLAKKYLDPSKPLTVEDIHVLVAAFPELDFDTLHNHFHYAEDAYFFGRTSSGKIRFPTTPPFSSDEIINLLQSAIQDHFSGDPATAAEACGLETQALLPYFLKRDVRAGTWTFKRIAKIAQGLRVDKRKLYHYFRERALGRVE